MIDPADLLVRSREHVRGARTAEFIAGRLAAFVRNVLLGLGFAREGNHVDAEGGYDRIDVLADARSGRVAVGVKSFQLRSYSSELKVLPEQMSGMRRMAETGELGQAIGFAKLFDLSSDSLEDFVGCRLLLPAWAVATPAMLFGGNARFGVAYSYTAGVG